MSTRQLIPSRAAADATASPWRPVLVEHSRRRFPARIASAACP
jgi:hypothetical protein